jgi:beta-glucosidase
MRNISLLATAIVLLSSAHASQPNKSTIDQKIDALLAKMIIEEKLGQLNQLSADGEWNADKTAMGITTEQTEQVRKGFVGSFLNATGSQTLREIQRIAVEETRLKIPLLFAYDVIHGYRTIFPIPLAEACTWDPELLQQSAHVAAVEASAAGLHWTFAPMVDIARDPRWGRIMEGSGEDPILGSRIAAARVKGFQGTHLNDRESIMACAKHFAAYGAAEAGRDYNTVDISERTLHEIYLPPFKAAVDAGVKSVMTSFNEIAGVPSTANKTLVTTILRKKFGFQGMVVSDWTSINELIPHGIAANRVEAGTLALNAGVDMDMVSEIYAKDLPALVRSNQISQKTLDDAVRRVLRVKFELGLFDDPYRDSNRERERSTILNADHRALARKVAQKSIVLLKNEKDILPLSKTIGTLAVIGPLADNQKELLGSWSALGKEEDVITVKEGIRKKVSAQTKILYGKGCDIQNGCDANLDEAKSIANQADAVIVVVGESAAMSGEAASKVNIDLPIHQQELVQELYETGKPLIVVLMNGRPLTISVIAEKVPAILETWFLGIEAGNAIADVLFGDVNPSGKLPITFPRNIGQIPIYYNHKNTGRPISDDMYTTKYIDSPQTPLYPFGFGLSYTSVAYENINVSPKQINRNGNVMVSVDVTNTGKVAGEEIVQLYIQDNVASVTRPVKELKDFTKIKLQPGEKSTVHFTLSHEQLAFHNLDMKWTIEPGIFHVFVGGNSQDLLQTEFELK